MAGTLDAGFLGDHSSCCDRNDGNDNDRLAIPNHACFMWGRLNSTFAFDLDAGGPNFRNVSLKRRLFFGWPTFGGSFLLLALSLGYFIVSLLRC